MSFYQPTTANLTYLTQQYFKLYQSSVSVGLLANQIYLESMGEMMISPQSFIKRNFDYAKEVLTPPQPAWQTPYEPVNLPQPHARLVKLLHFAQPDVPAHAVLPTLILPPQAGHHSYIADYSPEQSQTQTLRRSGLGNIYCIEWQPATLEDPNASIEEYMEAVRYIIQLVGGKANLVGDCQGGWMATIFAALYPEMVNALVLAGAPIDFQAGNSQITQAINYVARNYPDRGMAFFRAVVALGGGIYRGQMQITNFNLMRPNQLPERYMNLYRNIHDKHALKRFRQMKDWYDYPQDIAGDFYLWLAEHLFRDNELIKGELLVGGRKVDLKAITCPLFLIGGSQDHITIPVQVFNAAEYVSTPADKIEKYLIDAGHIGLFMGKNALDQVWKPVGEKLYSFSQL